MLVNKLQADGRFCCRPAKKKKYGDVQWNIPAYRHLITLKIIVFVYAVIVIVFQVIGRRFCGRLL